MLRFECVQDIDKAKELWELFSPKQTIYDDWDFRFTFYKYYQPKIFFYVGYLNDDPIGVFPLQQENNHDFLDFFGGDYMEDNRVLIKAGFESHISDFYKFIKTIGKKYCLEYISGQDDFTKTLPIIDFKYILPLDEFSSYEDYLAKYFKGKDLREFKRKIRNISENHKFEIITNNFSDLEYLFEYNINRFKDHSMFQRPYRKEIFRELVGLKFEPVVNSYIVDGKLEAVSMALIYRDTLESFNTGVSPNAPKNLREYIYILKIDHAIKKGLKKFDSFIRSYGWKEQWCFSKIPQYKFPEV